ncbi:MAG: type I glyceraldehyde-3-phosphate dehydrogenase [Patescibacteria group bacterium]
MALRVGINGFGRIGRLVFRMLWGRVGFQVVKVNDLVAPEVLANLLKFDSVHGIFNPPVRAEGEDMVVGGDQTVFVSQEKDPGDIAWDPDVDVVIEATGHFRKPEDAKRHLGGSVGHVLISAPAKGGKPDASIVMGVNHEAFDPKQHRIVDVASCTTNCFAPMVKVLLDRFGIERGLMTTIHAYTNDQRILDLAHSDLRRARAAGINMIPTSTGAAKASIKIFPELEGRLNALSIRVPVVDGSLVDFTADLGSEVSVDEVNAAFAAAANNPPLRSVMAYGTDPFVSTDIIGRTESCIIDSLLTQAIGNQVKVFGWYDNEAGYSARMVDVLNLIAAGR